MQLLSPPDYNSKTNKSAEHGYYTPILHLAPHTLSGYQTCPKAGSCKDTCLFWSGHGPISSVVQSRIRKTKMFFEHRDKFMAILVADIWEAEQAAAKRGLELAVRLNGTSDIAWEKVRAGRWRNVMEAFPGVQFYDYTRIAGRMVPDNYHLTFSMDFDNANDGHRWMNAGGNVATIFDDGLPTEYLGREVIDGDKHDLRFLDPKGVVVGLKRKRTVNKALSAAA